MTTFADLQFQSNGTLGERARIHFPNGYGASVIRGLYTYGGSEGLYELGVLCHDHLTYDTPITDDVIGHLSEDDVTALLQRIEALSKAAAS